MNSLTPTRSGWALDLRSTHLLFLLVAIVFPMTRPLFISPDSVLRVTIVLALVVSCFFVIEKTRLSLLYLVVAFNAWMLALSVYLTDGHPSYLSTDEFIPFYIDTLFLEIGFWSAFWFFSRTLGTANSAESTESRRQLVPWPTFVYSGVIMLLVAEIAVSSARYFAGYAEDSDVGTPMYDIAAMLLAIAVFSRATIFPKGTVHFGLESLALLLALFVAVGSGKRLALSFLIIAYLSQIRSKRKAFAIFMLVALIGYVHGIIRDSLQLGTLSVDSLIESVFFTNQGGAFHSAAVYLRLLDDGLLGATDRAVAFISTFIGPLILPVSVLPDVARLNQYAMDFYVVQGNGGMIGVYSWIYLGVVGPPLLALSLALLAKSRLRLFTLLYAFVLLGSIRWTLYNVIPLIRLMGYGLPLFYFGYLLVSAAGRRRAGAGINPNGQSAVSLK